ncbi:hypothetical protein CIB84_012340, partial [Bambusicola thoracicus]
SKFLLLAFGDRWELWLLHFWLFLGIYVAALLGDGLVIRGIACDHCLHTPMDFFLLNLALLDLGGISTTLPKSMANSLLDSTSISYSGCVAQVVVLVMSYDRYIAIRKPLHYGTLLSSRTCATMAAAAWGCGFLSAVLHTANTFSLPLCQSNAVNQFFCEIPQILKLSHSHVLPQGNRGYCGCCLFSIWVFRFHSFLLCVFGAVLRMPSEQRRYKAFSTCLPHLALVSLFLSTAFF